MTVTISRLYNSYPAAQDAVNALEAAGVKHGDISIIANNADDWYEPDTLASVAEVFRGRPQASIVHGDIRRWDDAGPSAYRFSIMLVRF